MVTAVISHVSQAILSVWHESSAAMDAGQIPGLVIAGVLVGCYQRCKQLEEAVKLR